MVTWSRSENNVWYLAHRVPEQKDTIHIYMHIFVYTCINMFIYLSSAILGALCVYQSYLAINLG